VAKVIDLNEKLQELKFNSLAKTMIARVTELMMKSPPKLLTQSIIMLLKNKNDFKTLSEVYIIIEIVKLISYDYYINMATHEDYEFIVNQLTAYITAKNNLKKD